MQRREVARGNGSMLPVVSTTINDRPLRSAMVMVVFLFLIGCEFTDPYRTVTGMTKVAGLFISFSISGYFER
jgi:hypothetical protein